MITNLCLVPLCVADVCPSTRHLALLLSKFIKSLHGTLRWIPCPFLLKSSRDHFLFSTVRFIWVVKKSFIFNFYTNCTHNSFQMAAEVVIIVTGSYSQGPQLPRASTPRIHHSQGVLPFNKDSFITPASINAVFCLLIQLPPNKDFFITPASIYTVFFSLILLPLNKNSFITPASIYGVFLSNLQLIEIL